MLRSIKQEHVGATKRLHKCAQEVQKALVCNGNSLHAQALSVGSRKDIVMRQAVGHRETNL